MEVTTGYEARRLWNTRSGVVRWTGSCVSHRHDGGKFQGPMGIVSSTVTDTGTVGDRDVVGKSRVDVRSFVCLFDNNLKSNLKSNLSAGRPNPRFTDRFPDYHDP